jgi:hypothetical protein
MNKVQKITAILWAAVFIAACAMIFTSCVATYEHRKGYGCLGATGISAARPSYRPR